MKLRREREPMVAVPRIQIDAEAARRQKLDQLNIDETNFSVNAIKSSFMTCPRIAEPMSAFRIESLPRPREGQLKYGRFEDGVVLTGATQSARQDRLHQLVIPDSGDVIYRRLPFNAEHTAVHPLPVLLEGVEAIADDVLATHALAFLAGAVTSEAKQGWRDAYRPDVLKFFRQIEAVPVPA